jgi:N-methylhydantoinase B
MVTAGWNRALNCTITGWDPRRARPYVDILFLALKGGSGATYSADGYDHIGLINCAGGILAQDYEMFEIHDPHFLLKHEYWPDSAGPGRWRGGLGVETEFVINAENATLITFGDGIDEEARAFGFFGGGAGTFNEVSLAFPDGTTRKAKSKEIIRNVPAGTLFRQKAGGGGGYGDPKTRPADRVLEEVIAGILSFEGARRDYGVVVDPDTLMVDREATQKLREGSS